MAVRASIGTGNFTTAGTWGTVDSTSYLNAENATESLLTTAYSGTRSSAFTPGAITISHIGIKLCERLGTTGTISVNLELDSDNSQVAGTEVTIDVADLPNVLEADLNGGWIFFKLASPVTLAGATAYQVAAKTSSANMVDVWCDGTADNMARALVTTTTGAPAAGDDLIVAGEKTGQGTGNDFVVTMDNTAATDFGSNSSSNVTPSLAICDGGTLQYGTTAATAYLLRQSGHVIVYSGGTLNMGTTGTPMPRDSSAVLEFDCGSDGAFGLIVRNGGTWNGQGQSRTSGKDVWYALLNTDEAAAQTTLGVDTDTGWLNGDEVGIAPTTQTSTQGEKRTMNAGAGASSIQVSSGLTNAHSGTSPTQAEVVLLTRNVRVRAVTSSLVTFVSIKPTATVDLDWVEFYYIGEAATDKRGINIETTTGSFSMVKCSVHDTEDFGVYITGAAVNNVTVQYCAFHAISTAGAQSAINIATATTGTAITIDGNIITLVTGVGIALNDTGNIVTNNRIAGSSSYGIDIIEAYDTWGTMSGNIIHSTGSYGMNANVGGLADFLISNSTMWRCTSSGLTFNSGVAAGMTKGLFDGLTMFGNSTCNILFGSVSGAVDITFRDLVSNGDSTFATTSGFRVEFGGRPNVLIYFDNCDFSTASGIKTAHTNDVILAAANSIVRIEADNCKFGAATEFNGFPANAVNGSYIRSNRHDRTSGSHKALYKYGTVQANATTYKTAAPSEEMLPLSASVKICTAKKRVAVASGETVSVSVWVRKNGTYNGNAPRLKVKRNAGLGITSDTILDTFSVGADTWEELTGTTASVSDDGVLEFEVDCDGTAGSIFVDDWSVT